MLLVRTVEKCLNTESKIYTVSVRIDNFAMATSKPASKRSFVQPKFDWEFDMTQSDEEMLQFAIVYRWIFVVN